MNEAANLLGQRYQKGYNVPVNDAYAFYWYQMAAERGDQNALKALKAF